MMAFWSELGETKNFNDTLIFQNITKIVTTILIILHGNTDVDRVFSVMLDVKTKKKKKQN